MESTISFWPVLVLLMGIVAVIVLITILRVHAFLSLILSAVIVGILSKTLPGDGNHFVKAVELTMTEFGSMAGKIAFIIALAAILGVALTESGAAEKLVIKFIDLFGEKYASVALLFSGFVLSIPVFFDTVFFLLIPIAYSMGKRMKGNYMIYVLAVCTGGVITHSLVPPTPGPLIMAETMELNLGFVIVTGLIAGILPSIAGYIFSNRIGSTFDVHPPDFVDTNGAGAKLPSFTLSFLPIAVPLILIMLNSINEFFSADQTTTSGFSTFIGFIGNKNIAMLLGTIIALWVLAKQKGWGLTALGKSMEKPLEIAGIIILITGAGGAFGGMIRYSGITEWIQELAKDGFEMNFILLAWAVAAVMKTAQGSSTVAMITSAGIMYSLIGQVDLSYHPIFILLAIGFGALFISWMNDSGFWVVCKMGGFTEKQTLKSWTVLLVVISIVGLIQTLILSKIFPLVS